jgi:folate-binding protein YgfZ
MSRDRTTAARTGAGAAAGAAADYRALRDGAAAIDLSAWTVLGLRGPDARAFLHGVTTQDLEHLANGEAAPALVLTEKGRALALVWIGFVEGTAAPGAAASPGGAVSFAYVLAEAEARETLRPHLERFRIMEDVEFTGPAGMPRLLGVAGPGRADLVSAVASVIHGTVAFRGDPLSFVLVPADTPIISLPAFAEESAVEAWRLAEGIPRTGVDFDAERIATELALPRALSMTKGCYVGQEVVARTATRGHVRRQRIGFRFRWEGEPIALGTELRAGGRAAGHVTSTAPEPGTGEGLGMGFLSAEALAAPVEVLAVVGARSTHVRILPWPL